MVKRIINISIILLSLLFIILIILGVNKIDSKSGKEGIRIAESTVKEAVATCYAIDGVYPATFNELKEKSKIAIDEAKYVVIYEIFASNLMPDITILERH